MKHILVLVFFLWFLPLYSQNQVINPDFEKFFLDQTLRIDYFHIGDAKEEMITLDRCYLQGTWAGSTRHLIFPFNYGRYQIKVFNRDSQALIYAKGFDSYFGEYKTTGPAQQNIKRTYHESALIPFPKEKIIFKIEKRNQENRLNPLFEAEIDPSSPYILKRKPFIDVKVFQPFFSGPAHQKVDLAIIGEGYTAAEEAKFQKDLEHMVEVFFSLEPYKSMRQSFNIYGVLRPSAESGCDEPRNNIYRNTSVHATFDSLGLSRYVLTEDNPNLRDIAGQVPYDALAIMVNHKRYGGGGIYNLYCVFTSDNPTSDYLFLHEFGHSFGGLGDEYYTSEVAYNDFYPAGIEPLEPNLSALLDMKNLKWKELLTPKIFLPTPWNKEVYEKLGQQYQKAVKELELKMAAMAKEGKPEEEIAQLHKERDLLSKKNREGQKDFFQKHPMRGKVGAFEGAGYAAKGLYRPMLDCLMFSGGLKPYCRVCEAALARMIRYYSE